MKKVMFLLVLVFILTAGFLGCNSSSSKSDGGNNGGNNDNGGQGGNGIGEDCFVMFVTFDEFEQSVRAISAPGYSLVDIESDCYSSGGTYEAFLRNNSQQMLLIELTSRYLTGAPTWSDTPYQLDNRDAEYQQINQAGSPLGYLGVYLPQIEAELLISSTGITDRAGLESIARQTGFLGKTLADAEWPAMIPTEYRVSGMVYDITVLESDEPSFSHVVVAMAMMNPQLYSRFNDIRTSYFDDGTIKFPDGTAMIYPTEDLYDHYNDYSRPVIFYYYVP